MISSIHLIGSRKFGGAERFFVRLVEGLHELSQPVIAVSRPNSMVSRALSPAIRQIYVPFRNVWDVSSILRIRRLVAAEQPQIVQTYMGRATRLTRLPKQRSCIHIARLGGFYKPDGYRHADAWIGNTNGICRYLRSQGFPEDRVFHVPNFIEIFDPLEDNRVRQFRSSMNIPDDALLIVALGRFVEKKGFQDLIEAFARLPASLGERPVHMLLAGDGPCFAALKNQARGLGVLDRIHWAGWQDELAPVYQSADLFVCPSRHEPLGNVILEAWANGLPVLSTATDGARELVINHDLAVLVPCRDPQALGREIQRLFENDRLRQSLAEAGKQHVRRHFTKERILQRYLEVYDELLHRLR